MKTGVTISSIAHVALLGWGLLNLSSPEPMVIDLGTNVAIEFETSEESNAANGEKEAEVTAKPTPKPTKKPEIKPEAENVGDSKSDKKSESDAKPKEQVVEKSATAENPDNAVTPPDPVPVTKKEDQPTPATELAALNDPATPVTEEKPAEEQQDSEAAQQLAALPTLDKLIVPTAKPARPKPNTAKTKDRKNPDETPSKKQKDAKKADKTSAQDEIKNLLNKQEASSTGAKRSSEQASLGTKSSKFSDKLSRRDEDSLVQAISRCSTGQAGKNISPDLKVRVDMQLTQSGELAVNPRAAPLGGTAEERSRYVRDVLRYVVRCAPYDFLPKDKYETWKEIQVTFHVAEMFQ